MVKFQEMSVSVGYMDMEGKTGQFTPNTHLIARIQCYAHIL